MSALYGILKPGFEVGLVQVVSFLAFTHISFYNFLGSGT
jgi:hypothetical protein